MGFLAPPAWVVPSIFVLFAVVIAITWLLVFQNRAIDLQPRLALILIGPLKPLTEIKPSRTATSLWVAIAVLLGLFVAVLWRSRV